MPRFPTPEGFIHYQVTGPAQAPPLVLLHNFMSTGQAAWGPMVAELSQAYRVILPDLPGHGQSQGHPPEFSYREMARWLASLLAREGALEGHLAGVSAGGMIAQWLVHQGLARPRTLCLMSTTYSNNPATTRVPGRWTTAGFRPNERWLKATARLHDPHHYAGYFQEVLLPAFRGHTPANTIDLSLDDLREWRFPVCIVHGQEDQFFPPSIPEQMAQALPDAELHILPDQSHGLIFRRPWAVKRLLLDFLARRGGDESPAPSNH